MNGTEWTEPGQGATFRELWTAWWNSPLWNNGRTTLKRDVGMFKTTATNLRLTGAPLTAEDLKRIAECK